MKQLAKAPFEMQGFHMNVTKKLIPTRIKKNLIFQTGARSLRGRTLQINKQIKTWHPLGCLALAMKCLRPPVLVSSRMF